MSAEKLKTFLGELQKFFQNDEIPECLEIPENADLEEIKKEIRRILEDLGVNFAFFLRGNNLSDENFLGNICRGNKNPKLKTFENNPESLCAEIRKKLSGIFKKTRTLH